MTNQEPLILAIESSCDDTSVAVLKGFQVLSNCVHNQDIHKAFGGVVPEMASRAHIQSIVPTVLAALKTSRIEFNQLEAIAVTQGPGLLGSLLVGHSMAKSLSLALSIPLINVHHIEGHMLSCFLVEKGIQEHSSLEFPYICLTVSGGHTQIVIVKNWNDFEVLGQTLDDSVGEAFDKSAKLLSLDYPGGPIIDRHSEHGNPDRFVFNKTRMSGVNFSFSGIKTNILQTMQKEQSINPNTLKNDLNDWCASIQKSLVYPLIQNTRKAIFDTGIRRLAIAGGVSANTFLRDEIKRLAIKEKIEVYIPPFPYTMDNAAMIGAVGQFSILNRVYDDISSSAKARITSDKWKYSDI
mgnify:CR=1 FL=1